MKTNYKLKRLCGSYYGFPTVSLSQESQWNGSNIVYDGNNVLITAAMNRIQVMDLTTVSVRTLPVEARSNITCLALSGPLLVVVDVQNHALLINIHRGVVLHRSKFKQRVKCLQFSPNGQYLAVATGKLVQVWSLSVTTTTTRTVAPWQLERTLTGSADVVTTLVWSPDGSVLVGGSRDGTVHVWTLRTTRNFVPVTLSGHKSAVVGVYFVGTTTDTAPGALLSSVSADGAVVTWEYEAAEGTIQVVEDTMQDVEDDMDAAAQFFQGGSSRTHTISTDRRPLSERIVGARWSIETRKYFDNEGAGSTVTSTSISNGFLAVGFSSGIFGLYELPDLANIHTLSVGSNQLVKTCQLNKDGEWLALACPNSQQILVWEWRSETYVLKHRGHAYGMRCLAYAVDGVCIATAGEDGKIKVWNAATGMCYVTMEGHTAPVTAITFANASVLLTASLDGTVQAHDLHRYRRFRTFTTPTPTQFLSLAADAAGEIVAAGTSDPFHIYTWSLQTGKALDVLVGHTGPVCGLTFQPQAGMLASASWDGTVRTWDLYKGNVPVESFQHATDVVCVAYRPDGKQVCSGTINGLLSFWDPSSGKLVHEIDGRKDVQGGRKMNDRMAALNNAASRYFTSVCYSADGTCVLAGGNSMFVCLYEISQQILLKKFQVSRNRSLDGVLNQLNSKNLGEGGPLNEEDDSEDDGPFSTTLLPGARRGDDGSRKSKVEVLTRHVAFSPTGREWALVSGEGLHVYSLDDDMIFDPISLSEEITPNAVRVKLASKDFGLALRMALHLNEYELVESVLEDTPYSSIPHVVRSVGPEQLEHLLQCLAKVAESSPHMEFYLQWTLELLQTHGSHMEKHRGKFMRAFRGLHKVWAAKHSDLNVVCNDNQYTLAFVQDHGKMVDATMCSQRDQANEVK